MSDVVSFPLTEQRLFECGMEYIEELEHPDHPDDEWGHAGISEETDCCTAIGMNGDTVFVTGEYDVHIYSEA